MKVILDRKGLQASQHLRDRLRLSVFLTELLAMDCWVAYSPLATFSRDDLHACDVLVITTRSTQKLDYTPSEIRDICDFVRNGGGLLLMSNHADWPGVSETDHSRNDARLAREFGVTVERTYFRQPARQDRTTLSGPALNIEHPIISGAPGERPIRSIVTNTCCSITSEGGTWVVALAPDMVDRHGGLSPAGRCFAHALHVDRGRVVTIADSGFIGTDLTVRPGHGLIDHGDNRRFVINVIRWLGKELD
jgi:hypothetical protein